MTYYVFSGTLNPTHFTSLPQSVPDHWCYPTKEIQDWDNNVLLSWSWVTNALNNNYIHLTAFLQDNLVKLAPER